MPFVKADLDREKAELDRLINESKEARSGKSNRLITAGCQQDRKRYRGDNQFSAKVPDGYWIRHRVKKALMSLKFKSL